MGRKVEVKGKVVAGRERAAKKAGPSVKQTESRRPDGKFAKGNKVGKIFEPGQSGNPAGRPKSVTFSEACRRLLAEIEDETTQETVAMALARAAIREAKAGSAQHLKEINDRVEGKAKQPIELKVESPREALAAMLGISPEELPEPKQDVT